jgi:uncharacterized membrane protein
MSDLVAIAYPDQRRAAEVLDAMKRLQEGGTLDLHDAVAVTKDAEGRIKVEGAVSGSAAGAAGGLVLGALVGLIFLAPVVGALFGAAAGDWLAHVPTPNTLTTSCSKSSKTCRPAAQRS